MGQVLQAGQGQIPSRQAQIKAGIPKEVSSETINKVCASGIRAAGLIDAAIRAGDLEVGVAGGMESMSNAPYLLKRRRFGYRMGDGRRSTRWSTTAREPVPRQQMFRGDRGRRRARDDARRPRPLGAALAPAGDQGDRRGPAGGGDRAGHGRGRARATRSSRSTRRRAATRRSRRSPSSRRSSQGRLAHGRQLAGRQRRRRRAGARQRRLGAAHGKEALATIVAQAQIADDFAYLARTRPRPRRRRSRRPA